MSFWLSVATVAAAVGCLVAVAALLGAHDLHTAEMLDDMNAETTRLQIQFENEVRAHDLRTAELLDEMNADTVRMLTKFENEVQTHDLNRVTELDQEYAEYCDDVFGEYE